MYMSHCCADCHCNFLFAGDCPRGRAHGTPWSTREGKQLDRYVHFYAVTSYSMVWSLNAKFNCTLIWTLQGIAVQIYKRSTGMYTCTVGMMDYKEVRAPRSQCWGPLQAISGFLGVICTHFQADTRLLHLVNIACLYIIHIHDLSYCTCGSD